MTEEQRAAEQAAAAERPEELIESLRAELDEANRKAEEYLDLLRRARADLSNFRRRVDEERAEQSRSLKAELFLKILPVLDDFQRAVAAVPPDLQGNDWVEGVLLIERKLRAILEGEGLRRIEALGKEFNPWEHEAVLQQTSPELEEGRILAVLREGYRLGDRVIRPAQVVVAHKGA